jgi:hypothetical protein
MPTVDELAQRLRAIEQEKAQVRAKLSAQKLRDDTRQKILIGAVVLAVMRNDAAFHDVMLPVLKAAGTRLKLDRDKMLIQSAIDSSSSNED